MKREQIKEVLLAAINDSYAALPVDAVTEDHNFTEDLGFDSLDCIELIMKLEKEFEISIPDELWDGIKTVGEALDYLATELE